MDIFLSGVALQMFVPKYPIIRYIVSMNLNISGLRSLDELERIRRYLSHFVFRTAYVYSPIVEAYTLMLSRSNCIITSSQLKTYYSPSLYRHRYAPDRFPGYFVSCRERRSCDVCSVKSGRVTYTFFRNVKTFTTRVVITGIRCTHHPSLPEMSRS